MKIFTAQSSASIVIACLCAAGTQPLMSRGRESREALAQSNASPQGQSGRAMPLEEHVAFLKQEEKE